MKREGSTDFAAALKRVAEQLQQSEEVRRHDKADEKEAWTLAHAFLDLADSFKVFTEDYLTRLKTDDLSEEQVNALLVDIGEEFRHILYHIRDSA